MHGHVPNEKERPTHTESSKTHNHNHKSNSRHVFQTTPTVQNSTCAQADACMHARAHADMHVYAGRDGGREGWMDGFALNFLIYLTLLNLFEASVVASDGRVVCRSRCCLAASHSLETSLLLGLRRPRPCRSLMPKPLPIRRSSAAGRALSSSLP